MFVGAIYPAIKTVLAAGVAATAIAGDIHEQEEAILVAIDPDFLDGLKLSGGFPL